MQLHSLTSLRFFAALFVFTTHLFFLDRSPHELSRILYSKVFAKGYLGVTFFFVLSGFILAHSYGERLVSGRVSRGQFLVARIARIYPLHLLVLASWLVLFWRTDAPYDVLRLGTLAANALLLQAFVPSEAVYFSFNGPSWSLSSEMFFYALFPFLVALATRRLAAVAGVLLSLQLGGVLLAPEGFLDAHGGFLYAVFPVMRLIDFVVGILLYRLYQRLGELPAARATLLQWASVATFGVFAAFHSEVDERLRADVYYVLPMALAVFAFAHQEGFLARLTHHPFLVLLGDSSYAFYLVHVLVIRLSRSVWEVGEMEVLRTAACLGVSVASSILLFKLFEVRAKRAVIARLSGLVAARHGV